MKIIVNRAMMLDYLSIAESVIPSRTPKPVLEAVKMTADGGKLHIAATNLSQYLQVETAAVQIDSPGQVAVCAAELIGVMKESGEECVTLETSGDFIQVFSGRDKFNLWTLKPEDFPPPPGPEDEFKRVTVKAGTLYDLLGKVSFAAAKESTRYAFNGVNLHLTGSDLECIATDGRRLAMSAASIDYDGKEVSAIVSRESIATLTKMELEPETPVEIELGEKKAVFTADGMRLHATLIEGAFPPYEDIIPKDSDRTASLNREDFAGALRRSCLLTTEESKGVRFEIDQNGVHLHSRSLEKGESEVYAPCSLEGKPITIGFNPSYMLDGLRACGGDDVKLGMTAPNRPGLLTAGNSFRYVIMPVNLN